MSGGADRRARLRSFAYVLRATQWVARAPDVIDELDAHERLRRAVWLSLAHESCDFLANGFCERDDCSHCNLTKALEETNE